MNQDFCPFKSLLQEFCLKEGLNKPIYETASSDPSHSPAFISTVAIDGRKFRGEPVKTKKEAEILTAKVAWYNLKERQLCPQPASSQILKTQEALENTYICSSVIVNDLSATEKVNSNTARIFEPDSGKRRKDELADENVFLGRSSLSISGIESAENLTSTDQQDQPVDDAYASLQDSLDVYNDMGLCHQPVMEDKSSFIREEVENNFSVSSKILVYSRASNVKPPSGATALPRQNDKMDFCSL